MDENQPHIERLEERVRYLLELVSSLSNSNELLLKELDAEKADPQLKADDERIPALEEELRQLRKENKTLKEKQKLIQNKAERLVYKLNQLNV